MFPTFQLFAFDQITNNIASLKKTTTTTTFAYYAIVSQIKTI